MAAKGKSLVMGKHEQVAFGFEKRSYDLRLHLNNDVDGPTCFLEN